MDKSKGGKFRWNVCLRILGILVLRYLTWESDHLKWKDAFRVATKEGGKLTFRASGLSILSLKLEMDQKNIQCLQQVREGRYWPSY